MASCGGSQNNEDFSSDELVIDIPREKEKEKVQPESRKRKRSDNGHSSDDDEDDEEDEEEEEEEEDGHAKVVLDVDEIEQNVACAAVKNNLTSDNVKKILKRVVLNEHVLAIVKLREEEMEKNTHENLEPKLTRAKTKKLKSSVSWPLPITPVKIPQSVSPEVTSLISQDLLDEESDEEYEPQAGEHSDDDKDTIESSDAESLPLTPATPDVSFTNDVSITDVKYTEDGIFKIPQNLETTSNTAIDSEATIALRTRSKLSLSDIPIEKIEESFFPPDITKDMYEVDNCQMDNVWRDFLTEFSKPLSNVNEDDDETDPEYNAAADREIFDFEELREDAAVEVSKKELKNLVEELFNDMDEIMQFDDLLPITTLPEENAIENNLNFLDMDSSKIVGAKKEYENTGKQENISNFANGKCELNTQNQESQSGKVKNWSSGKEIFEHSNQEYIDNQVPQPEFESTPIQPEAPSVNATENNEIVQPSITINIILDENRVTLDKNVREASNTPYRITISNQHEKSSGILKDHHDTYFVWKYRTGSYQFTEAQLLTLGQQMRQHVQLATQCFLQFYGHPKFWPHGPKEKDILTSLKCLSNDSPTSAFHTCNLTAAINLCEDWERQLSEDTPETQAMFKHLLLQIERSEKRAQNRCAHYGKFDKLLVTAIWNSNVFVYPKLLPSTPFRAETMAPKEYLESEDMLIALGLEQFLSYLAAHSKKKNEKKENISMMRASEMISKYMMPFRPKTYIRNHISKLKFAKEPNPIKHYFDYWEPPNTVMLLIDYTPNLTVGQQPLEKLPYAWQKIYHEYFSNKKRVIRNSGESRAFLNERHIRVEQPLGILLPWSEDAQTPQEPVAEEPSERGDGECQELPHLSPERSSPPREPPDLTQNDRTTEVSAATVSSRLKRLKTFVDNSGCFASFVVGCTKQFLVVDEVRLRLKELLEMLPSMPSISSNSKDGGEEPPPAVDVASTALPVITPNEEKTISFKPLSIIANTGKQRQASKAQKELEANRAMFISNDPYADDLKETLYAASYLEKVKTRLSGKADGSDCDVSFDKFQTILNSFDPTMETPVDLYHKVEQLFRRHHPDLLEEFLTFLTPGQATEIGRFRDHFVLTCMSEFIERLQIYFANKPAHLRKVLWSLERLAEKPESELSMEVIKNSILPLLKGNQYLIDWFLKLFPDEKPPESLLNNGYEILDCDRMLKDTDDPMSEVSVDFETVNLPHIEENFGNETCECSCHETSNEKYKNRSRHCLACGMKYIQGRVYVQHGRALRAVNLNWLGNGNSRIDHARRLSAPVENRQMNSKKKGIDPISQSSGKNDSDEERISPKRAAKCSRTPTSKIKHIKISCSRNMGKSTDVIEQNKSTSSKVLLKDNESSGKISDLKKSAASNKNPEDEEMDNSEIEIHDELENHIRIKQETFAALETESAEANDANEDCSSDITNVKQEAVNSSRSVDGPSKIQSNDDIDWTRNEDKIILLILRSDIESEDILSKIKKLLPHRTMECIRERVQNVMTLLKKIAFDP